MRGYSASIRRVALVREYNPGAPTRIAMADPWTCNGVEVEYRAEVVTTPWGQCIQHLLRVKMECFHKIRLLIGISLKCSSMI